MFPFPQNTHGALPPQEPTAGSRSHAFRGRRPAQAVPRVAKIQLLRQALAERMCDIEIQQPAPIHAPALVWQPAYAPQGSVATPPADRLFPRWETMGYGDHLLTIKAFAKSCFCASTMTASAFNLTSRGWKASRLGKSFLEVVSVVEFWSRARRDDARFDPQVQLAFDVFQQVGLLEGTAMGPLAQVERWFAQGYAAASVAVRVNAFFAELSKRGQQVSMGRKMQFHEDMHAARGREVRSYLTGGLKRHPGCSFLRFELCMGRNSMSSRQDEYGFMLDASARYLRDLRQEFGEAIVCAIRKVDRGNTSDYLVHVVLAIDGPRPHELFAMRQTLSEGWKAQTQGIGYLIDCSAVGTFMYRGADYHFNQHESSSSLLDKAAVFLADTDRIIHVGYDEGRTGLLIGSP